MCAAPSSEIKLPRESIDAEKPNGQDEKFIILIDDIQVPYEETETNSQSRLITINFQQGDSEIEIIGTQVIPEFGTFAAFVLIIGIVITIMISKNKFPMQVKI